MAPRHPALEPDQRIVFPLQQPPERRALDVGLLEGAVGKQVRHQKSPDFTYYRTRGLEKRSVGLEPTMRGTAMNIEWPTTVVAIGLAALTTGAVFTQRAPASPRTPDGRADLPGILRLSTTTQSM